jgi:CDP-diacylglycerol--serine O-phosphatidyltransferase
MSIRLARFNIDSSLEPYDKKSIIFFKGVPSPAGGLLILLPIILDFKVAKIFNIEIQSHIILINIYSLIVAFLMPSRIPTFSFKGLKIKHEYIWFALLCSAIFIVMLTIYPWYVLPLIAVIYIISIFCSIAYAQKIN